MTKKTPKKLRTEIAMKAVRTRKLRAAGHKAWKTRTRRAAALKAWETRRGLQN